MAVASRGKGELLHRHWRDQETSPERTKVWVEPKQRTSRRRVPVVYYLCRNGQLEHPHFMEVSLSSSEGLFLKDVIDRLNLLRGKGMSSLYSWSSKRSYKNGYVWQDLTEDDLILPAHGNEYVLKGSELLYPDQISPVSNEINSSSSNSSFEKPREPSRNQRRTSWGGSLDLNEYKVYKSSDPATANACKGADVSTQTDDRRPPRRRSPDFPPPHPEAESEEISPPPSSSSPDTLETLIKTEVRSKMSHVAPSESLDEAEPDRTVVSIASGRMRASAVLMQLISCGSIQVKEPNGDPTVQYSGKLTRGRSELNSTRGQSDLNAGRVEFDPMDREYFSGSLVETKKKSTDDPANGLKRSNSYNADRSSKIEGAEQEIDTSRAKCIPRKPRTVIRRETVCVNNNNCAQISRSNLGSKRISDEDSSSK